MDSGVNPQVREALLELIPCILEDKDVLLPAYGCVRQRVLESHSRLEMMATALVAVKSYSVRGPYHLPPSVPL